MLLVILIKKYLRAGYRRAVTTGTLVVRLIQTTLMIGVVLGWMRKGKVVGRGLVVVKIVISLLLDFMEASKEEVALQGNLNGLHNGLIIFTENGT